MSSNFMSFRPSSGWLLVRLRTILVLHYFISPLVINCQKPPNIVLFLTDDQDSELGGMEPLSKARSWIAENGVTFENSFVSTPVCCPSRSSILTGMYQPHTRVVNNTLEGNCWGTEWRETSEKENFAAILKSASNYTTFYAGKYLNRYGDHGNDLTVPPGWDYWAGLVGNSRYYDYILSINGKAERHGFDYEEDYLTDVIGRKAESFLDIYERLREENESGEVNPFLMVLATPAPHDPFTPAPQYKDAFPDKIAPRTPAFNYVEGIFEQKHWFMRTPPTPLREELLAKVDDVFRNRWRTLLSVDDMIDRVMNRLDELGVLDDTFILLTSDHGYHLGTFALTIDKRMPYETDIRVPLLVRGPGVKSNEISSDVVVNIDLAPTIVEMGGGKMEAVDGVSFLPSILQDTPPKAFIESNDIYLQNAKKTRESFLVTYSGEYSTVGVPLECKGIVDVQMSQCRAEWDCKCQDVANNTYYCIRTIDDTENSIFCEFDDEEGFIEAYDLSEDPYQLNNIMIEPNADSRIRREYIIESLEEIRNVAQGVSAKSTNAKNGIGYTSMIQYMKQLVFNVIHYVGF